MATQTTTSSYVWVFGTMPHELSCLSYPLPTMNGITLPGTATTAISVLAPHERSSPQSTHTFPPTRSTILAESLHNSNDPSASEIFRPFYVRRNALANSLCLYCLCSSLTCQCNWRGCRRCVTQLNDDDDVNADFYRQHHISPSFKDHSSGSTASHTSHPTQNNALSNHHHVHQQHITPELRCYCNKVIVTTTGEILSALTTHQPLDFAKQYRADKTATTINNPTTSTPPFATSPSLMGAAHRIQTSPSAYLRPKLTYYLPPQYSLVHTEPVLADTVSATIQSITATSSSITLLAKTGVLYHWGNKLAQVGDEYQLDDARKHHLVLQGGGDGHNHAGVGGQSQNIATRGASKGQREQHNGCGSVISASFVGNHPQPRESQSSKMLKVTPIGPMNGVLQTLQDLSIQYATVVNQSPHSTNIHSLSPSTPPHPKNPAQHPVQQSTDGVFKRLLVPEFISHISATKTMQLATAHSGAVYYWPIATDPSITSHRVRADATETQPLPQPLSHPTSAPATQATHSNSQGEDDGLLYSPFEASVPMSRSNPSSNSDSKPINTTTTTPIPAQPGIQLQHEENDILQHLALRASLRGLPRASLNHSKLSQLAASVNSPLATISMGMASPGASLLPSNNIHLKTFPQLLTTLNNEQIRSVYIGHGYAMLVTSTCKVLTFGRPHFGRMGVTSDPRQTFPVLTHHHPQYISALLGKNVISAACGWAHSLFLTDSGEVYSVGSGSGCRLGVSVVFDTPTPVLVEFEDDTDINNPNQGTMALSGRVKIPIISIACGYSHNIALDALGQVFVWGSNHYGQLGLGHTLNRIKATRMYFNPQNFEKSTTTATSSHADPFATPSQPDPTPASQRGLGVMYHTHNDDIHITAIACGPFHSAAISIDGVLYMWGSNRFNQLGLPFHSPLHCQHYLASNKKCLYCRSYKPNLSLSKDQQQHLSLSNNTIKAPPTLPTINPSKSPNPTQTTAQVGTSGDDISSFETQYNLGNDTKSLYLHPSSNMLSDVQQEVVLRPTPLPSLFGVDVKGVSCAGTYTAVYSSKRFELDPNYFDVGNSNYLQQTHALELAATNVDMGGDDLVLSQIARAAAEKSSTDELMAQIPCSRINNVDITALASAIGALHSKRIVMVSPTSKDHPLNQQQQPSQSAPGLQPQSSPQNTSPQLQTPSQQASPPANPSSRTTQHHADPQIFPSLTKTERILNKTDQLKDKIATKLSRHGHKDDDGQAAAILKMIQVTRGKPKNTEIFIGLNNNDDDNKVLVTSTIQSKSLVEQPEELSQANNQQTSNYSSQQTHNVPSEHNSTSSSINPNSHPLSRIASTASDAINNSILKEPILLQRTKTFSTIIETSSSSYRPSSYVATRDSQQSASHVPQLNLVPSSGANSNLTNSSEKLKPASPQTRYRISQEALVQQQSAPYLIQQPCAPQSTGDYNPNFTPQLPMGTSFLSQFSPQSNSGTTSNNNTNIIQPAHGYNSNESPSPTTRRFTATTTTQTTTTTATFPIAHIKYNPTAAPLYSMLLSAIADPNDPELVPMKFSLFGDAFAEQILPHLTQPHYLNTSPSQANRSRKLPNSKNLITHVQLQKHQERIETINSLEAQYNIILPSNIYNYSPHQLSALHVLLASSYHNFNHAQLVPELSSNWLKTQPVSLFLSPINDNVLHRAYLRLISPRLYVSFISNNISRQYQLLQSHLSSMAHSIANTSQTGQVVENTTESSHPQSIVDLILTQGGGNAHGFVGGLGNSELQYITNLFQQKVTRDAFNKAKQQQERLKIQEQESRDNKRYTALENERLQKLSHCEQEWIDKVLKGLGLLRYMVGNSEGTDVLDTHGLGPEKTTGAVVSTSPTSTGTGGDKIVNNYNISYDVIGEIDLQHYLGNTYYQIYQRLHTLSMSIFEDEGNMGESDSSDGEGPNDSRPQSAVTRDVVSVESRSYAVDEDDYDLINSKNPNNNNNDNVTSPLTVLEDASMVVDHQMARPGNPVKSKYIPQAIKHRLALLSPTILSSNPSHDDNDQKKERKSKNDSHPTISFPSNTTNADAAADIQSHIDRYHDKNTISQYKLVSQKLALRDPIPPKVRRILWPLGIGNMQQVSTSLYITLRAKVDVYRKYYNLFKTVSSDEAKFKANNVHTSPGLLNASPKTKYNSKDVDTMQQLLTPYIKQTFAQIDVDLVRTFPHLAFYQSGSTLKQHMAYILSAIAIYRPDLGYTQGLSFLVGLLLLYLDEVTAFCTCINLITQPFFMAMFHLGSLPLELRYMLFEYMLWDHCGGSSSGNSSSTSGGSMHGNMMVFDTSGDFDQSHKSRDLWTHFERLGIVGNGATNIFIQGEISHDKVGMGNNTGPNSVLSLNNSQPQNITNSAYDKILSQHLPSDYMSIPQFPCILPTSQAKGLFFIDWGMTLFTKSFDLDFASRIWDCYVFCGEYIVYMVYIAILETCKKELLQCTSFDQLGMFLRKELKNYINEDTIMAYINKSMRWRKRYEKKLAYIMLKDVEWYKWHVFEAQHVHTMKLAQEKIDKKTKLEKERELARLQREKELADAHLQQRLEGNDKLDNFHPADNNQVLNNEHSDLSFPPPLTPTVSTTTTMTQTIANPSSRTRMNITEPHTPTPPAKQVQNSEFVDQLHNNHAAFRKQQQLYNTHTVSPNSQEDDPVHFAALQKNDLFQHPDLNESMLIDDGLVLSEIDSSLG